MKRALEVIWITNYLQDIHADFFAIYHILDWESLDGPLFISLAERLPMYEGALQGRLKLENQDEGNTTYSSGSDDTGWAPGQSISMAEALSGDSKLLALNEQSQKDGWGDLFQIEVG